MINLNHSTITWHTLHIDETLERLKSSGHGLSDHEASERLKLYGPNEIALAAGGSALRILLRQFTDFMIIVLVVTAVISGVIGDLTDTLVILLIVVLNALLGFSQEYRAEKAISALRKMAALSARVVREGHNTARPASELVPGDIVLLESGNVIPADIRILESNKLQVSEASLTGESNPVEKQSSAIQSNDIPLGDRTNMAFKGTSVVYGRGKGIVIGTGLETELGKIALMLHVEDGATPLQKRLAAFGRKLALGILVICAAVFVIGLFQKKEPILMLLTSLSLAVAAIPEALPAVITIALAMGVSRMVRQNALMRRLPAVETLGSVTYICTDKTGTLTQNKMQVVEIATGNHVYSPVEINLHKNREKFNELLTAMALNSDVESDQGSKLIGDPTELAVAEMAHLHGFARKVLEIDLPRVAELPFESIRKCMTTIHKDGEGYLVYSKGAPEVLLDEKKCKEVGPFIQVSERMAADGLRVMAFCRRRFETLPAVISPEEIERDWEAIGLVGIMDPPRDEVKEAIAQCKTAGIVTVLITGDHVNTARSIAKKLDILNDADDLVLTGRQMAELSEAEFLRQVEHVKVYARVSPAEKLKIVIALKQRGQIVAMTGDGVNDAPALKSADIGIAMGIAGTDVSKEAAQMILLDDNFATIVKAIQGGRRIYDNIRNFIKFVLTSNSAEVWTVFLAPLLGLPIPLLPIHILWINLITDGLPGLALTAEPTASNTMQRPPRAPMESILSRGLGIHILWVGLLMGALTIGMQAVSLYEGDSHWQTMVFTQLGFIQLAYVLAIRSESESVFKIGFFTNKPLLGAVAIAVALQLATIYVPFLNPVFRTEPLSASELALVVGVSISIFFVVEAEKAVKRWMSRNTASHGK